MSKVITSAAVATLAKALNAAAFEAATLLNTSGAAQTALDMAKATLGETAPKLETARQNVANAMLATYRFHKSTVELGQDGKRMIAENDAGAAAIATSEASFLARLTEAKLPHARTFWKKARLMAWDVLRPTDPEAKPSKGKVTATAPQSELAAKARGKTEKDEIEGATARFMAAVSAWVSLKPDVSGATPVSQAAARIVEQFHPLMAKRKAQTDKREKHGKRTKTAKKAA